MLKLQIDLDKILSNITNFLWPIYIDFTFRKNSSASIYVKWSFALTNLVMSDKKVTIMTNNGKSCNRYDAKPIKLLLLFKFLLRETIYQFKLQPRFEKFSNSFEQNFWPQIRTECKDLSLLESFHYGIAYDIDFMAKFRETF